MSPATPTPPSIALFPDHVPRALLQILVSGCLEDNKMVACSGLEAVAFTVRVVRRTLVLLLGRGGVYV